MSVKSAGNLRIKFIKAAADYSPTLQIELKYCYLMNQNVPQPATKNVMDSFQRQLYIYVLWLKLILPNVFSEISRKIYNNLSISLAQTAM